MSKIVLKKEIIEDIRKDYPLMVEISGITGMACATVRNILYKPEKACDNPNLCRLDVLTKIAKHKGKEISEITENV